MRIANEKTRHIWHVYIIIALNKKMSSEIRMWTIKERRFNAQQVYYQPYIIGYIYIIGIYSLLLAFISSLQLSPVGVHQVNTSYEHNQCESFMFLSFLMYFFYQFKFIFHLIVILYFYFNIYRNNSIGFKYGQKFGGFKASIVLHKNHIFLAIYFGLFYCWPYSNSFLQFFFNFSGFDIFHYFCRLFIVFYPV